MNGQVCHLQRSRDGTQVRRSFAGIIHLESIGGFCGRRVETETVVIQCATVPVDFHKVRACGQSLKAQSFAVTHTSRTGDYSSRRIQKASIDVTERMCEVHVHIIVCCTSTRRHEAEEVPICIRMNGQVCHLQRSSDGTQVRRSFAGVIHLESIGGFCGRRIETETVVIQCATVPVDFHKVRACGQSLKAQSFAVTHTSRTGDYSSRRIQKASIDVTAGMRKQNIHIIVRRPNATGHKSIKVII